MEKERVADAAAAPAGPSSSMAAPRDAAPSFRDAPPQPPPQHSQPPSHGHSRVNSMGAPEHQHAQPRGPSETDMVHVITRLEQQVAFNYNMIQGHHQDIQRVSDNVARVQHEMVQVIQVIEEMRKDILSGRIPAKSVDPARYDPADVEVLANQIANVTNKANEVDNLKVQIELMKQRLKRIEGAAATPGPPPDGAAGRTDQQHFEAMRAQQLQQAPSGHPPAPTRPGAAPPVEHGRQPGHPSAPVLESQPTSSFHGAHERPPIPSEQAQQAARQPGFRPTEALPPPTTLSGWRPADTYPPSGGPPPAHSHPLRAHPQESEPPASGWAAVNLSQAGKRSLDEHHPPHDSSQPGSPKRPKLAPLKPRSSFGDEHHQSPYAQPAHIDPAHQARGRIPSGDAPHQPPPQSHPVPAPGPGAGNSYRFITSTGQPDSQEHWRAAEGDPAAGGRFEHTTTGGTGRGRGRGSRGGRRGGRGRGGRTSSGSADVPPAAPDAPIPEHAHNHQVPPEWREHQWAANQQAAANGHYPGPHAYSPVDPARRPPSDLAMHQGQPHGLPYPAGHEHEFPATPVASNADPYQMAADLDSASRKTRTKPIRNSDGVLIRKDGRPDMRSVSSANNLRKVHAKKEAEKAEMEGRTPTSGRSLAPANSSSLSDDEGAEEGDYMDEGDDRERSEGRNGTPGTQHDGELPESVLRHREMMHRMFHDNSVQSKSTAQAYFPRADGPPLDVKREDHDNKEREARWRGMEDTRMRDADPASEEREASQRLSERVSRDQTSVEATPNTSAAVPAKASEQPESETEAATGPGAAPEPIPVPSKATAEAEKDSAKKDSTQLEASAPRVPSEPAAAAASETTTAQ